MAITLVPDPTYKGKGTAPLMIKADAMRKLHAAGESVSDIALRYGITYHNAYKQINPARKAAGSTGSTSPKPLTAQRLTQLSKTRLMEIASARAHTPAERARVEAAVAELDRRDPNWLEPNR